VVFGVSCAALGAEVKESKYTGRVVDAEGKAVEGAKAAVYVWTFSGGKSKMELACEAKTDSEGKFAVAVNLPEEARGRVLATVLVLASKEGLALGWTNLQGPENEDIAITLEQPDTISGVVVDESGAPVADATVRAFLVTVAERRRAAIVGLSPLDVLVTRTDASGRFSFSAVPESAKADFLVSAPGRANVSTMTRGATGSFAAGQAGVKIPLPKEAVVEGVVLDKETGKGVSGISVSARDDRGTGRFFDCSGVSGQDGAFRIGNLAPMGYTIQLVEPLEGLADWVAAPVTVKLEAGKTESGVKVELEKGAVLEVSVKDAATGKPIENANVYDRAESGQRHISGISGADGLFRARVLPGKYLDLQVRKQGLDYFMSGEPVTLANGETKRIDVALKAAPKLTGVAVDEKGNTVAGAEVWLGGAAWGDTKTDENGEFEISIVRHGGEEGPMYVIGRQVEKNVGAVCLVEDETKPVEVKMLPGLTIKGRVVDPSGKPIAGATGYVMVRVERYGLNMGGRLTTDKDGSYEVKAIPADNVYDITMSAKGYGETRATVDIGDGQNGVCPAPDITLAVADKSVAGIVVDKDGKGAADAYVSARGEGQKHNQVSADKDGKFRIWDLAQGEVQIIAQPPGGNAWGQVTARAGDQNVKIVLGEQGVSEERAQPKEPEPLLGKPLPDLKALSTNTAWAAAVDAAAGKQVLVVFHDSSQRPSRRAMSKLAEASKSLAGKGVAVFAVEVSGQKPGAQEGPGGVYATVWLSEKVEETKFAWGVKALPWLVLTDREHVVKAEGFPVDELYVKMTEVSGK